MQVATGLSYIPLQTITLIDAANSANHMHGDVVSYNATTGALVLNVKQKSGTGNICNWLINLDSFNVTATTVLVTQGNTTGKLVGTINVNGTAVELFETPTTMTNTLSADSTREKIGTYTNENGTVVDLYAAKAVNALWATATTDPTATGNTGTLPRFVENTVNGSKWYIDSTGVAKLIEGAADGCGVVYFDTTDPTTATIFDTANPPVTNDNALKNLDCATYVGSDGSFWTSNGTTYKTKTFSAPTHRFTETTTSAGQTAFTLPTNPIGSSTLTSQKGIVKVSRNGVDISRAWSWVGANGTYTAADNYGCVIDAGDKLQFHWEAL
jgi:hypothetical protein